MVWYTATHKSRYRRYFSIKHFRKGLRTKALKASKETHEHGGIVTTVTGNDAYIISTTAMLTVKAKFIDICEDNPIN